MCLERRITRVNNQATLDNTKPQASSLSEPQPEVIFLYKMRVIVRNPLFTPKENANCTLQLAF